MRTILIKLIRFYTWAMVPFERRKERKRIEAKLAKLREHDNFNYPTY